MDNQAMKTSNFWNNSTIVRLPGEALCSWRYRTGSGFNFDRFTDRFLTPVDKFADLIICAKQCNKYCGFRKIARRRDGKFDAYCPEDPADAFVIDQQEVLLYNIRESTLVEEVARALNITPYMAKLSNHEHSWKVGNIIVRGESHSVFFTLQWDTELLELILELNRLMHNPYVLLGSSGHMYNNVVAGCLANGDAVFVPLNETLDFNQDAELEHIRPFSWEKLLLSPEALNEEPENIFRKCGDAWEVRFDGGEKFMLTGADTGARYLHFMLGKPGVSTPIARIINDARESEDDVFCCFLADDDIAGRYSIKNLSDSERAFIADDKAIRQYYAEIKQIEHDIEIAEHDNDDVTAKTLERDVQKLYDEIDKVISKKDQKKEFPNSRKKALDALRRTVLFTIDKIEKIDPNLSEHFKICMKYGQLSGYFPGREIRWFL